MVTKDLFHLLFLILLTNIVCGFGDDWERWSSCAPEEDIGDCKCRNYQNNRKKLTCEESHTIEEYISRIRKLEFSENTKLDLEFSELRKTPNDISSNSFSGLNIRSLEIYDCNITKWADEVESPGFVGLENSLEHLKIHRSIIRPSKSAPNHYKEDAAFTLGHLKKLKEIELRWNTLWNFCKEWFGDGLSDSLERVSLEWNQIWHVCDDTFANLKNLRYLSLSGNKILFVSRNMFPNPAVKLEDFDLSFNVIRKLPQNFFENMPALYKVRVVVNKELTQLTESIWRPVWSQLRFLQLGMYLNCFDTLIGWTYNLKRPEYLEGTCNYPEERHGKSLFMIIDEKQKGAQ